MAEQKNDQKCAHPSCYCIVPAGTEVLQRILQEGAASRVALQLHAHRLPDEEINQAVDVSDRRQDVKCRVPSVIDAPPSAEWPFRYPLCPELPAGEVVVRAEHVDDAYVNRAVRHAAGDDAKGLPRCRVGRALARHGNARARNTEDTETDGGHGVTHPLAIAFRLADPGERLAMCVDALEGGRTPAALVATASVCVEVNDLEAAARDLDEAIAQAPEWAAAHYERGKLWLRADDMVKAGESFQRAAELLPGFGPAWANLGGTLGRAGSATRSARGLRTGARARSRRARRP